MLQDSLDKILAETSCGLDEVDARRMNFTKKDSGSGISDIRNFYLDIARGLKQMGL